MREKQDYLVITFAATTDAMAAEKYCEDNVLPGRLIPVPREITAGCGLAWRAPPEERERLLEVLNTEGLRWSEARVLKL